MAAQTHSLPHYVRKLALREGLRAIIKPLVTWEPMRAPREGYSVLIGCHRELGDLLLATLRSLSRQRATHCREVILSFDGLASELGASFEEKAREMAGSLPLRFLYCTPKDLRIARRIDWGPVYAWMNWSRGLAACTTRHALLHDLDALLIDPEVFESRYAAILDRSVEYLGIAYHGGGGTVPEDRLARTFELMLDAAFVRAHHQPLDVFNKMWTIRDARGGVRRVEFDTFLYCQHTRGRRDALPMGEEQMVHPSNMIGQYTDFRNKRPRIPPNTNLPMIPYYELVGGNPTNVREVVRQLRASKSGVVTLWGWELHIERTSQSHRAWMRKQAGRVEDFLFGGMREDAQAYFDAIDAAPGC